jgi:hypothetical protein
MKDLETFKLLVAHFQRDMKSNSLWEFVTWLELQIQLEDNLKKQARESRIKREAKWLHIMSIGNVQNVDEYLVRLCGSARAKSQTIVMRPYTRLLKM